MLDTILSDTRFIQGVHKALAITRRTGYETAFSVVPDSKNSHNYQLPNNISIGDEYSCGWHNAFIPVGLARLARAYKNETGIEPKMFDKEFILFATKEEEEGRGIAEVFPGVNKPINLSRQKPYLDFHTHPLESLLNPSQADIKYHKESGKVMMIALPRNRREATFACFQLNYELGMNQDEMFHQINENIDSFDKITCGAVYKGRVLSDKLQIQQTNGQAFK